jgi:hypothetical protein
MYLIVIKSSYHCSLLGVIHFMGQYVCVLCKTIDVVDQNMLFVLLLIKDQLCVMDSNLFDIIK